MIAPLPDGHRIRYRFCWAPIVVAGHEQWLVTVRVVQRLVRVHHVGLTQGYHEWHDVGFYDELYPAKPAPVREFEEAP